MISERRKEGGKEGRRGNCNAMRERERERERERKRELQIEEASVQSVANRRESLSNESD